jgi:hypothetical protein
MVPRLRVVAPLAIVLIVTLIVALLFAGGVAAIEPALAVVFGALLALAAAGRAHPVSPASFPAPSLLALVASGRMARASLPRYAR